MNKKLFAYLLFFVVLVLGFYYFLFRGNDFWRTKLPVISYTKPFEFKTQDGLPFTDRDMLGKVTVVEYFFTNCKSICPKMNTNMKEIFAVYKDEPNFMILSHTCDPERDTVARMKVYADSLGADTRKWLFLTGRKDSLYNIARSAYLLDDPKNSLDKIEDQFIHTQFFALVDKDGKVRGQVYDGLKNAEIEQLKKDIRILLDEKSGTGNFVNGIFNNNPR
ncbi:MAG: electron transporter SenC [Bacteroidetes bacterium 24-39-8]|jgi:protein SCO1/2|nr:MAG: electron transporter SenC [Bacteroidetes bacterium 24-39-8]OZA67963.1 MAG: electron transporter SenC [Sphingobacteriia bacterium 39-39-8]HQR92094.1 SCO family protein [Sediminibacterium sp.]HQS55765.1 SCO family protein [Sediminibacterium sp.]